MKLYKLLPDHTVVEADDARDWAKWFQDSGRSQRRVARDRATVKIEGKPLDFIDVSTVFIGIEGQLFETMVFGGPANGEQIRTNTWEAALQAHERMKERVRQMKERVEHLAAVWPVWKAQGGEEFNK